MTTPRKDTVYFDRDTHLEGAVFLDYGTLAGKELDPFDFDCGIGRRIVMDEAWMFSNDRAVSLDPLTELRLSYDIANQPAALRRLGNARGRRSALRRLARAARVLRRGRNGDLSPVAVKKAQR